MRARRGTQRFDAYPAAMLISPAVTDNSVGRAVLQAAINAYGRGATGPVRVSYNYDRGYAEIPKGIPNPRRSTRKNPLKAPSWMTAPQARTFLALPDADARMAYIDALGRHSVQGRVALRNPAPKRTYKRKKPGKRKAFQAQDLLFDRTRWSVARAKAWAKKNGHKYGDVSESEDYIHLKQHAAGDYQKGTLHNIEIAKNVQAIVGVPRTATDAGMTDGYNTMGPRQGSFAFARPSTFSSDDTIW